MKKIVRISTTKTEMIVDNLGQTFIIGRKHNTNTTSELVHEHDYINEIKHWERMDKIHREELVKENAPSLNQQAEAGETYALKQIVELHKEEKASEFEVKGIWWDMTLNFLKNQAIGFIIGTLRGLIKDQIPNMIKLADWLIEQLEGVIVNQYNNLKEEEIKGVIRNELKQYPQFKRLAEKLN